MWWRFFRVRAKIPLTIWIFCLPMIYVVICNNVITPALLLKVWSCVSSAWVHESIYTNMNTNMNQYDRLNTSFIYLFLCISVPGAVPPESIQGSTYEEKIALKWREPIQTYGIIKQYEVSLPQLKPLPMTHLSSACHAAFSSSILHSLQALNWLINLT